jgi:hypothetical protein
MSKAWKRPEPPGRYARVVSLPEPIQITKYHDHGQEGNGKHYRLGSIAHVHGVMNHLFHKAKFEMNDLNTSSLIVIYSKKRAFARSEDANFGLLRMWHWINA